MSEHLVVCPECRENSLYRIVRNPYVVDTGYDGFRVEISISNAAILYCVMCREVAIPKETKVRIRDKIREIHKLLTPSQMQSLWRAMSPEQKSDIPLPSNASVSDWLDGSVVQNRRIDNFFRNFMESQSPSHNQEQGQ